MIGDKGIYGVKVLENVGRGRLRLTFSYQIVDILIKGRVESTKNRQAA